LLKNPTLLSSTLLSPFTTLRFHCLVWIFYLAVHIYQLLTMSPTSIFTFVAVACTLVSASAIYRETTNTSGVFHFFNECHSESFCLAPGPFFV